MDPLLYSLEHPDDAREAVEEAPEVPVAA